MSASETGSTGGDRGNGAGGGSIVSSTVARGVALVALAVVVGIVLLQIVDDGSSGSVSTDGGATPDPEATTTVPNGDDGSTATTASVPDTPERTPEEVRIIVLNGGAQSGSAATMSEELSAAGYVNQETPNNDAEKREGNSLECRETFEREAESLATVVQGVVLDLRDPGPAVDGIENVDCIVVVGAAV